MASHSYHAFCVLVFKIPTGKSDVSYHICLRYPLSGNPGPTLACALRSVPPNPRRNQRYIMKISMTVCSLVLETHTPYTHVFCGPYLQNLKRNRRKLKTWLRVFSLPKNTEPMSTCVPQTDPPQKRSKTRGEIPKHIVCVLFPETSLAIGHVLHSSRLQNIIKKYNASLRPLVQNHEVQDHVLCGPSQQKQIELKAMKGCPPSLLSKHYTKVHMCSARAWVLKDKS